ncbi:glycerate kinase [Klebsiella pneumoniae]|uniref:Glycerate kinase n=1 Tax=Klebsiella pneumoniae TaxID=573 RepID=A0A377VVV8_KLEPN|nr:glycerate kinase [Klebsiella pneumoniae]
MPVGVARVAKRFNVPVIGIAGSLTADVGVVHQHGLDAVFSVLYTICTLDEALANAAANLRMTARNVAAVLQMGDSGNPAGAVVFVVRIRCVAPRSGNHPRWRLRLPGLPTEYRTVGRRPDEARSAAIRGLHPHPARFAGHIIHLI